MKTIFLSIVLLYAQIVYADSPLQSLMMAHYEDLRPVSTQEHLKKNAHSPYILVLFFSNQCPHCVNFSPLLKHFADDYQWQIEAISLNGDTLPEFPNAMFATQPMIDVAYQGKPVVYPALFIANTASKALYPVSFGELEYEVLKDRVALLTQKIKIYEERGHD